MSNELEVAANPLKGKLVPPYAEYETELGALMQTIRDRHPHHYKFERSMLNRFLKASFKKKQPLRERLGLDENLRREIVLHVSIDPDSPKVKVFRDSLTDTLFQLPDDHPATDVYYKNDGFLSLVSSNNISLDEKRTMKFSRWLSRLVNQNKEFFAQRYKLRAAAQSVEYKEPLNLEAITAELFELKPVVSYISANPIDIMMISERSHYSSCTQFSGTHTNSVLVYALDSFSAVIYTVKSEDEGPAPHTKLGRAMLFYRPDVPAFIIGRKYGTIFDQQIREISNIISSELAVELGMPSTWKAFPNHNFEQVTNDDNDDGNVYFDRATTRIVIHKSLLQDKDAEEGTSYSEKKYPFTLNFEIPHCLACQSDDLKNDDDYAGWLCEDCGGGGNYVQCENCECRIDDEGDEYRLNDYTYCYNCYTDLTQSCDRCGDRVDNDDIIYIERTDQNICGPCHSRFYSNCNQCDEIHLDSDLNQYEDEDGNHNGHRGNYCEDCIETFDEEVRVLKEEREADEQEAEQESEQESESEQEAGDND